MISRSIPRHPQIARRELLHSRDWSTSPLARLGILTVFLILTLSGLVGCCTNSSEVAIKVLDAETLQPIPYALSVIDLEKMVYFGYVDIARAGGNVDNDGRAIFHGIKVRDLWRTSIEFYEPGYYDAGLQLRDDSATLVQRIPKYGTTPRELKTKIDKDNSGAYVVKLVPNTADDPDTRLFEWTDDPHNRLQMIKRNLEIDTNNQMGKLGR